jgi:hypothetical protein
MVLGHFPLFHAQYVGMEDPYTCPSSGQTAFCRQVPAPLQWSNGPSQVAGTWSFKHGGTLLRVVYIDVERFGFQLSEEIRRSKGVRGRLFKTWCFSGFCLATFQLVGSRCCPFNFLGALVDAAVSSVVALPSPTFPSARAM